MQILFIRSDGSYYHKYFINRDDITTYIHSRNHSKCKKLNISGYIPYSIKHNYYTYELYGEYVYIESKDTSNLKLYNKTAQEFCSKTTNIDDTNIFIVGEFAIMKHLNGAECDMNYDNFLRIQRDYIKPSMKECILL